jgi:DnaJ domain
MGHASALKLAIALMHFPAKVPSVRSDPLPENMLILLRIAAGDEQAIKHGAALTGRSRDVVREAAAFYVEQILLFPDADSYRVLGATPGAAYSELRRNMAILLRWLHPDRDRQGERSVFAARVTEAWDNLKTSDRRAAYDLSQRRSEIETSANRQKVRSSSRSLKADEWRRDDGRRRQTSSRAHNRLNRQQRSGFLNRVLMLLFGRTAP